MSEAAHTARYQPYRIWSRARGSWCDYEVPDRLLDLQSIQSLLPPGWTGEGTQIERDVELVPATAGRQGLERIAVRIDRMVIGFLADDDALAWCGVIRRIVASGCIPITLGQLWVHDSYDGIGARFQIKLGKPAEAVPINNPPSAPYTMLPRSSVVQVTKEDEHTDVLVKHVPKGGYGLAFVTLHKRESERETGKPHVEVRIDDERIGQLTPQMSQRLLPMIVHLADRGLITAGWADITGSRVAAEVRIDCAKAHEVSEVVLNGAPLTLPRLVPALDDPALYDISAMHDSLRPVSPPHRLFPDEPPDGSVIKFVKGRRYTYIAVRLGNYWATTASSPGGAIDQVMTWQQLTSNISNFAVASGWQPVREPAPELRNAPNGNVYRFTISRLYVVGLCVRAGYQDVGDWYTTITDDEADRLPFGSYLDWSDIATYGHHIEAATEWSPPNRVVNCPSCAAEQRIPWDAPRFRCGLCRENVASPE
ncbi:MULTISPECIES: hypothetical protein [Mycolicibacterium]|uniref:hypothetical protein n=1 Tax=Mycolicibacterium TaxID=1866885 RepID=UPI001CA34C72|nr:MULTISPECIES: hypothetical protein [Mycolicibacterium]MDW5614856.1 hypothetical protein [Mycolicibacterium sp. D5.8-2]QZT63798.1 hypothetical protein JN085_05365 [Mycolicibacterium austroafricanum]